MFLESKRSKLLGRSFTDYDSIKTHGLSENAIRTKDSCILGYPATLSAHQSLVMELLLLAHHLADHTYLLYIMKDYTSNLIENGGTDMQVQCDRHRGSYREPRRRGHFPESLPPRELTLANQYAHRSTPTSHHRMPIFNLDV